MGAGPSTPEKKVKEFIKFANKNSMVTDNKKNPQAIGVNHIDASKISCLDGKYLYYKQEDDKVTFTFQILVYNTIINDQTNKFDQKIGTCDISIYLNDTLRSKFNEIEDSLKTTQKTGGSSKIIKKYPNDNKKCLCKDGKYRKVYNIKNKGKALYVDVLGKPVLLKTMKK